MRVFRVKIVRRCLVFFLCFLILGFYGWGLLDSQMRSSLILLLSPSPLIQGGDDADASVQIKREQVKKMMKHAWDGYVQYAWGANELRPISRKPNTESIYGSAQLGATIVDSNNI